MGRFVSFTRLDVGPFTAVVRRVEVYRREDRWLYAVEVATMPKGKRTTKKPKKQKNTGVSFEKTVARIQQMMDPETKVTHNEQLLDRVGNRRQYDVVVRGRFAGRDALGVIECRDWKSKMGPDAIEAFAKKSENLNANFRLMVSGTGFTDQALKLAKHEGIGCLSLLPRDPNQVGFGIGDTWYGRLYKWGKAFLTVYLDDESVVLPEGFDSRQVKWNGEPVIEWFEREFFSTYCLQKETGDHRLVIQFDQATRIEVAGRELAVKGLACTAKRLCQAKKQWVTWSGEAFYDWESRRFTVPPTGVLTGSRIDTTLSEWDDFDGVIPLPGTGEPPCLFRMIWDCFESRQVPDRVVNLAPIIAGRLFLVPSSPN